MVNAILGIGLCLLSLQVRVSKIFFFFLVKFVFEKKKLIYFHTEILAV